MILTSPRNGVAICLLSLEAFEPLSRNWKRRWTVNGLGFSPELPDLSGGKHWGGQHRADRPEFQRSGYYYGQGPPPLIAPPIEATTVAPPLSPETKLCTWAAVAPE